MSSTDSAKERSLAGFEMDREMGSMRRAMRVVVTGCAVLAARSAWAQTTLGDLTDPYVVAQRVEYCLGVADVTGDNSPDDQARRREWQKLQHAGRWWAVLYGRTVYGLLVTAEDRGAAHFELDGGSPVPSNAERQSCLTDLTTLQAKLPGLEAAWARDWRQIPTQPRKLPVVDTWLPAPSNPPTGHPHDALSIGWCQGVLLQILDELRTTPTTFGLDDRSPAGKAALEAAIAGVSKTALLWASMRQDRALNDENSLRADLAQVEADRTNLALMRDGNTLPERMLVRKAFFEQEARVCAQPQVARPASGAAALKSIRAIPQADWMRSASVDLLTRVLAESSRDSLEAAASSDARAQALVGTAYFQGLAGFPQDDRMAALFYTLGADGGDPIAQVNLGTMSESGRGRFPFAAVPDQPTAIRLYSRAAAQGHRVAQLNLAVSMLNGRGVPVDVNAAAQLLRQAADQGLAAAQFELANLHAAGRGVVKDELEAVKWLTAAAQQQHAGAAYALGHRYQSGTGVTKSPADATRWLQQAFQWSVAAADRGDALAMRRLGFMLKDGDGTAKDLPRSLAYFQRAVAQGDGVSMVYAAVALDSGEGVAPNSVEAVRLLRLPAAQSLTIGQFALAHQLETGRGTPANRAEAVRLYQSAARAGDQPSRDALTRLGERW